MLTLSVCATSPIPVEAEQISPDITQARSLLEIEKLHVQHGNREERLAEFFKISGDPSDGAIHIEGDCSRVKWIGAGMSHGKITIEGSAGMHLGSEMKGGEIHVRGSTGDWVGAEMRGGLIHVKGNAGHLAGAAYRGSRFGMRGGTLIIEGDAGNEVASVMRRGLVVIGGSPADFAGVSMIAGTLIVGAANGQRIGAGMKRGSIIVLQGKPILLPTFRRAGRVLPLFISIYFSYLRRLGFSLHGDWSAQSWRRHWGDQVALGRGEVLHREEA